MSTPINPLRQLAEFEHSPWLDFIRRSVIADGSLHHLVEADGLKGFTSNPSIFEKARREGTDSDEGFRRLAAQGDHSAVETYEYLAVEDIRAACDVLRPVYEETRRVDGYVSLEVSPYLALRTEEMITEARKLWSAVGRPNLTVKVPGTEADVSAIRLLVAEGVDVNVTLLFARRAHEAVAEAFIAGLEERAAAGRDLTHIASVVSFFASLIDAQIDKEVDRRVAAGDTAAEVLKRLRGRVAIANAKLAYEHYRRLVVSPRWRSLNGAIPQQLLWASTGVKDRGCLDVMYVEELIGPDTVNMLPPATMDAFRDHGRLRSSVMGGLEEAREVLALADRLGLDLDGVTECLVPDGVLHFADAAHKLLGAVAAQRTAMLGDRLLNPDIQLPAALQAEVHTEMERWHAEVNICHLWAGDVSLWIGAEKSEWLGWLGVVDKERADLDELLDSQRVIQNEGFTQALLLGMGGSSLGPEVLASVFGCIEGFTELPVLDSTDPAQTATVEARCNLAHTLVIAPSKFGTTLELSVLYMYFRDCIKAAVDPERAGGHFIAVTDPNSKLHSLAERNGFRCIFSGDPAIGGRYSALSKFGLVPAAVIGIDLRRFLDSAALIIQACDATVPPGQNPGARLGAAPGVLGRGGREKVTVLASSAIGDFSSWLGQLLAESTSERGRGLLPVEGETSGSPTIYHDDRLLAHLRLDANDDARAAQRSVRKAAILRYVSSSETIGRLDKPSCGRWRRLLPVMFSASIPSVSPLPMRVKLGHAFWPMLMCAQTGFRLRSQFSRKVAPRFSASKLRAISTRRSVNILPSRACTTTSPCSPISSAMMLTA